MVRFHQGRSALLGSNRHGHNGDVSDEAQITPMSGGAAPVVVYAAESVVMLPPETTLQAVADELVTDEIGLVVIGYPGEIFGVISERDLVRAVAGSRDLATTPASEVASSKVVWCDQSATVREVAELMMEQYVRHVLLEDAGRLVGIVSARDLLGAFTISTG